jgi:predicted Zn-dependent peptidase
MTAAFRKTVLPGGLRVVSERMRGVRSVAIGVWVCAGSRHERAGQGGIAHLLEHMLFKGTRTRTAFDIATSLESVGGHLNAFTEREFTCFYAVVLDENIDLAVDVIADAVQHSVLSRADLENEKRIVYEEIKNLEDNPEDTVHEAFLHFVFGDHPLGLSTLGSVDSIRRLTKPDLRAHHQNRYIPQNVIVAAAGCLDHDRLAGRVQRRFRDLPKGRPEPNRAVTFGPPGTTSFHRSVKQAHLVTGMPAYAYTDPKKFALIVLDVYLGGGMASRLFQNLREKQALSYAVYSFLDFWSDTGLWGVYAGTSPNLTARAKACVERELAMVMNRGIPNHALRRIKAQITRSTVLMLEDPSSRMNRLAKMEAYAGHYTRIEDVIRRIASVTAGEVRQTAQDLLGSEKRFTVLLEPKSR